MLAIKHGIDENFPNERISHAALEELVELDDMIVI